MGFPEDIGAGIEDGAKAGAKQIIGRITDLPTPSGRQQVHKAAGREYYTLWRHGADAPMGLYCESVRQAEHFRNQVNDMLSAQTGKEEDQFDIVKVKVIG